MCKHAQFAPPYIGAGSKIKRSLHDILYFSIVFFSVEWRFSFMMGAGFVVISFEKMLVGIVP